MGKTPRKAAVTNFKQEIVKFVDLTGKNLDYIPEYVFKSQGLESINLEKGNQIHVADRYILIDRIPTLRTIDGKDVSNVRTGISSLLTIFNRRLEEMFLTRAAAEIFNEESPLDIRLTKMRELAKNSISAGPPVLSKFKEYKIDQIISENYDGLVSKALEVIVETEEEDIERRKALKRKQNSTVSKGIKQVKLSKPEIAKDLSLKYLLKTHSSKTDTSDKTIKVWMCEFEPDVNDPSKTTDIVATCGSDSICFINCKTGEVIKKYKQEGEEFYCIGWTILRYPDDDTHSPSGVFTMLAAAGTKKEIKLIDPSSMLCYQEVSFHSGPVDALIFHPIKTNWLFSGSEDQSIVLWEIYLPHKGVMKRASKRLTLDAGPSGIVRQLAVSPHGKVLFAACDNGMYAWNISDISSTKKEPSYTIQFPGHKQKPLDSANCISSRITAVKRVNEGTIYLLYSDSEFLQDDTQFIHSLQWRNTKTPFLKFNFVKGANILLAGDDNAHVWLFNLTDIIEKTKNGYSKKDNGITINCEKIQCNSTYVQLFNHVTASSQLKEVVAVTDNNIVAIWANPAI